VDQVEGVEPGGAEAGDGQQEEKRGGGTAGAGLRW
jgi:hypothetical protein